MAERAGEQAPRKRVRTGCLSCRRRRRKCDEGRPECSNCRSKGLACRYGVNFIFVQSKQQGKLGYIPPASPTVPRDETSESGAAGANIAEAETRLQDQPFPDELFTSYSDGNQPEHTNHPAMRPEDRPSHQSSTPGGQHRYGSVSLRVSSQLRDSHVDNTNTAESKPSPTPIGAKREQYETELLTYYRYNVATVLDLGLGSLFFGIQTMIDSTSLEPIYHAILAVASSHRAIMEPSLRQVDEATSVTSTHFASRGTNISQLQNLTTAAILLTWRSFLLTPIESWPRMCYDLRLQARTGVRCVEEWLLLTRLHAAAELMSTSSAQGSDIFPHPPETSPHENMATSTYQLTASLSLLSQVLYFLASESHTRNPLASSSPSNWLTRWQELQNWFTTRSEEMQQILELTDAESAPFQLRDSASFPCVVFSNARAVVANTAHHLAAMISLQNKPRLVKPTADPISSISWMWHAQRVVGIVAAAGEAEIWDPLLVAALVHTARKLSHYHQIRMAVDTLKRMQNLSGLRLDWAINQLETNIGC